MLNSRRGKIRIWRQANEAITETVIRRRFRGAMKFIFWSCFSYDKKSSCYIWKTETAAERKALEAELERLNAALKPEAKLAWELETGVRRMGLRNKGGPKPKWKFTKERGKLVREGKKGGIDWYRYQKYVLIPKLLAFAKECLLTRPGTIVQENKAPAHASKNQIPVFMDFNIVRLLWPGNSLDLNMIEPCWSWMKRMTSQKGPLRTRKEAEKAWLHCWNEQLT